MEAEVNRMKKSGKIHIFGGPVLHYIFWRASSLFIQVLPDLCPVSCSSEPISKNTTDNNQSHMTSHHCLRTLTASSSLTTGY